jgi:serine/threonine protein kinase/formylglycine-generating enzyme required for sulfatase activity
MTADEDLLDYARDCFGVPPALLDKAVRLKERTGRPLASVLVEMGVLSPDQVRSFEKGEPKGSAADIWGEPAHEPSRPPPRLERQAEERPPVERAPVGRALAERPVVERAPVERPPVERAPVERAPVERAPVGRMPHSKDRVPPEIRPVPTEARPLPTEARRASEGRPTPEVPVLVQAGGVRGAAVGTERTTVERITVERPAAERAPISPGVHPSARPTVAALPPPNGPLSGMVPQAAPASLPDIPPVGELESVPISTRMGDSQAEADVARRLRAAEVAEHHARWLPHLNDPGRRYRMEAEIARGGMGRIVEAYDQILGRTVAMKLLIGGTDEQLAMQVRFTEEAQITGQLEHPNIVPVHDLGLDDEGQLYFTMKRVGGRTLRDVIKALRRGDGVMAAAFPLHRLLEGFKLICLALAYAHSRGVIHRDLKPSNIMFGDFGEVLVMDWGLAKILPKVAGPGDRVTSLRDGESRWATRMGEVIGTPGYMPPELAMGQLDDVDGRSDVYSLGALLYEILTLRPPYAGGDSKEILKRQLREPLIPPRQRAPEREIPPALERICVRCLQREMDRRYPSALALHADIDAFMAGALEQARQIETAARLAQEGADQSEAWRRRMASLERLEAEVLRLAIQVHPAAPLEQLRPLWAAEMALERTRFELEDAFGRAERAFRQALNEVPDHTEARTGLSDLYADGLLSAERTGDEVLRRRQSERLLAVDRSRHAALHVGHGRMKLQAEPNTTVATLFRVEPQDFVLTPGEAEELGVGPREVEGLMPGRYLVVLRAPGRHAVQVPVRLGRGEDAVVHVRLRPDAAIGRDFAHIPAGRFLLGGDLAAARALPAQRVELPDFCLGRLPVTCRQYVAFLNALEPQEARARCPRLPPDGRPLFVESEGVWTLPSQALGGVAWDPHWPVFGVNASDAEAYCAWRSTVDGRRYRLPTELEWEAAARGADGRKFVWGDRFLASQCKNAESKPGPPHLEACGAYAGDRSPYGVMDMAGGVADWTASNDVPRPDGSVDRICKGGTFCYGELHARAASRHPVHPSSVLGWVGFRLAHDA